MSGFGIARGVDDWRPTPDWIRVASEGAKPGLVTRRAVPAATLVGTYGVIDPKVCTGISADPGSVVKVLPAIDPGLLTLTSIGAFVSEAAPNCEIVGIKDMWGGITLSLYTTVELHPGDELATARFRGKDISIALTQYENVQLRVGPSGIDGDGLFCKDPISPYQPICQMRRQGRVLNSSEVGPVDPTRTPFGGYVNHCGDAEPNCVTVETTDQFGRQVVVLVALRPIEPNAELTLRYTLYDPTEASADSQSRGLVPTQGLNGSPRSRTNSSLRA